MLNIEYSTLPMHKLSIKNMVCPRCISVVSAIFEQADATPVSVGLGEVVLQEPLSAKKLDAITAALQLSGFEIIATRLNKLVEDIRQLVASYLEAVQSGLKMNLSAYISQALPYDYSYLSDQFSSVEGKSIEQFFILLRIEKVKELLVYDQLSLTEIAYRTGFSSVHHLSAQFKKVTGLTASHFKSVGAARRQSLDGL